MSDKPRIEFTTAELATIEFRPGDTAVLMFQHAVSEEMHRRISQTWREFRPDIKCVVLQEGARLGVIRAADTPENPVGEKP